MNLKTEKFYGFLASRQFKHAVKTAIATVICLVLYRSLDLPKGYWAVFTAIAVMQATADTSSLEGAWKTSLDRLIGTMTGALVGLGIHVLIYPDYWQLVSIVFILIMVGVCITYVWPSMKLAGLTAVIVLLFAGHEPMTQNYAVLRAFEILLGAVVALTVSITIFPQRMHQYLFKNYRKHLKQILDLFQAIEKSFGNKHLLSTEQINAMTELLDKIAKEKSHIDHLTRSRRLLITQILANQVRLLKNIKAIGKSIGALPLDYYEDSSLMKVTQKIFFLIDQSLSAMVADTSLDEFLNQFEPLSDEYDQAFEDYKSKKYFDKLTMKESYAVVSLSIALKKMLDLLSELLKTTSDHKNSGFD